MLAVKSWIADDDAAAAAGAGAVAHTEMVLQEP